MRVSREDCGTLLASDARYDAQRSMSVVTSAQGWPVSRGDRLRVTSLYSNAARHRGVMGIMHLYIARGGGRSTPCPANPTDVEQHRPAFASRERPSRLFCALSAGTTAHTPGVRAPH